MGWEIGCSDINGKGIVNRTGLMGKWKGRAEEGVRRWITNVRGLLKESCGNRPWKLL